MTARSTSLESVGSALRDHLAILKQTHVSEDFVGWHLRALVRAGLRALWTDLKFVSDLGISTLDRSLTDQALAGAFEILSNRLDKKKVGLFAYHVQEIQRCFSNWVEFVVRDPQVAYWNLNYIVKLCKLMSGKVGVDSKIPGFLASDDIERLFTVFASLANQSPSTFYQLRRTLREIGELSSSQVLHRFGQESRPIAKVVTASVPLYQLLRRDIDAVYELSPSAFEDLICDRLSVMGMDVRQVGNTYASDGGVDIIATPRTSPFPFLLAVQVKHHRDKSRKTPPSAVKDLQSILAHLPFHAGMIVTNTEFTADARWWASQSPGKIQLHDISSIRNWVESRFAPNAFQDIPRQIQLTPRLQVDIW